MIYAALGKYQTARQKYFKFTAVVCLLVFYFIWLRMHAVIYSGIFFFLTVYVFLDMNRAHSGDTIIAPYKNQNDTIRFDTIMAPVMHLILVSQFAYWC